MRFGASVPGESFARIPDGQGLLVPSAFPSLGSENITPRVGPLVLSEVHYHPHAADTTSPVSDFVFIEIHNPTNQLVDLSGWRLRDGF